MGTLWKLLYITWNTHKQQYYLGYGDMMGIIHYMEHTQAALSMSRYFVITCFTNPPDGPKTGPTGKQISNFSDSFICIDHRPKNKIGNLSWFFHLTNRPKYFEAEIFVKQDI